MSKKKPIKLTGKQKFFADFYLSEAHFNGTLAAQLAGYQGNKATLAAVACENLIKPNIKSYIDERLSAMTMPANIVLVRLAEIADGKVSDFLDENKNFDLETAKKNGKDHLLKKLEIERTIKLTKTEVSGEMESFLGDDEIEEIESRTEIIYEKVKFEIHSSHEALRDIGKAHKLFVDRVDINANLSGNLDMNIQAAIAEVYGKPKEESDGDGKTDLENE